MAISEVCQFELKEEVDKLKDKNPGLSLAECIRQTIQFYADAGIELKEETAKTKIKRASQTIGSNELTPSTSQKHTENQENQEIKSYGGKRKGAGRKPKHVEKHPELNPLISPISGPDFQFR